MWKVRGKGLSADCDAGLTSEKGEKEELGREPQTREQF